MITSRQMQALELNSEYFGVSRLQLMENAGKAVAEEIASRFDAKRTRVAIFCGLGGNGGDGFVAARHLACLGFKVEVMLGGRSKDILDEEALRNWLALQALKDTLVLHEIYDSTLIPSVKAEVAVDALLGLGLKGMLRPPFLQLVKEMNEEETFRISVDVPTGVNSDSGAVLGEAVEADLTLTFHRIKPGLKKAEKHVGALVVKDIGLPQELERFAGPGDVSLVVRSRPPEAHKGDFGRLLIVGGSEVFSGAPALVALSALRSGVDLTYTVAPERTAYAISSLAPDLITVKLEGRHLNLHNIAVVK
ncbi:MAG: NAD(P)H-hydrate epimerase, partial [Candidatus Bathyarchaeota archaeon]